LDRDTGRGFEPASANLPIVEHSRLRTATGVAEVEFEDNSTLRITPDSIVEFPQLERLAGGATASSVHVIKGMAYVSLVKTQGNEFNLLFGQQKLQLPPSSHIRLHVDESEAKLAVLDGTVRIDGPSGPTDVPRKKTVTFHLQDQAQPTLAKDVAAEAFDSWDKNAAGYHAQLALCVRRGRHDVLRKLHERWRLWLHVASLFRQRCMGSIFEWCLGLVSGRGLLLGFSVSLGMDTLSLWKLVLLFGCWVGMATRRLVERAEQRSCLFAQRRDRANFTSPNCAAPRRRTHTDGSEPEASHPIGSGFCRLLCLPQRFSRYGHSTRHPGQTE
jgi:hypothetical protein